MNIIYLKYAVEVARIGSLSKASEALYVAQPNLSRAIKELEKENENESKDDVVDTASNRNQQGELNVQGAKKSDNKKSKCSC